MDNATILCEACNNHRWLCWMAEDSVSNDHSHMGPVIKVCTDCNPTGALQPPVLKESVDG